MLNKINYIPNETVITAQNLNEIQDEIINIANIVYPIGSLYFSTNNTSPAVLFGGTWEQIKDRFLLAAGDTYVNGTNGGSATNSHTHALNAAVGNHTLTVAEMPSHGHSYYFDYNSSMDWRLGLKASGAEPSRSAIASGPQGRAYTMTIRPNGGSQPHNHPFSGSTYNPSDTNNMPPYLTVYIWKRIS